MFRRGSHFSERSIVDHDAKDGVRWSTIKGFGVWKDQMGHVLANLSGNAYLEGSFNLGVTFAELLEKYGPNPDKITLEEFFANHEAHLSADIDHQTIDSVLNTFAEMMPPQFRGLGLALKGIENQTMRL